MNSKDSSIFEMTSFRLEDDEDNLNEDTTMARDDRRTPANASTSNQGFGSYLRKYRGFSSSLWDIFNDPRRHSDCCALAFCGVLSSDRNRYLLTKDSSAPTQFPNWWRRLTLNVALPLCMLILAPSLVYKFVEDKESAGLLFLFCLFLFLLTMYVLCTKWKNYRIETRQMVLRQIYDQELSPADNDVTPSIFEKEKFVFNHRADSAAAHSFFCCCLYQNDNHAISSTNQTNTNNTNDSQLEETRERDQAAARADICSCLFKSSMKLLGWYQCCGICGIAQEERQVNALFPKSEQLIDYVTFQPYKEYYPAIQKLRTSKNGKMWDHMRALSKLSIKMVKLLAYFMLFCLLFSLTKIDKTFTPLNVIVVFATFCQAFLVLYFVHWKWHRFNLSFDAVVKYFACGFFATTFFCLTFEVLLQIVGGILAFLGFLSFRSILDGVVYSSRNDEEESGESVMEISTKQLVFIGIVAFLESYIVAALTEELGKYYGYWMCEHPDFLNPDDLEYIYSSDDDYSERDEPENDSTNETGIAARSLQKERRTLKAHGSAITVAMVATATGFACCENLLYVFVYTPSNLVSQIATLLMRSLLPVHPLCAAIQSIGICRRDVEGDHKFQLGRSIFPAVSLHGSFDFVLIFMQFVSKVKDLGSEGNDTGDEEDEDVEIDLSQLIISMIIPVSFVLVGLYYFVCSSRAQNVRLDALDRDNVDRDSLLV